MQVRLPLLPDVLRWSMVLGVAAFIFYASVLTVPAETPIDPARPAVFDLDKWRHFVAYGTLGGVLSYALVDRETSTGRLAVLVGSAAVLYGVGIELSQSQLPNRYFSVGDAGANALGAVLSLSWYLVRPYLDPEPVTEFLPGTVAPWLERRWP